MTGKAPWFFSRPVWLLRQFLKQIWVRAALFSVAAVVVALLAAVAGPYLPDEPNLTLAAGSVDDILNILATGMLSVTTFSMSIMVAAYFAATSSVTPRSTLPQNTLATFVCSFLFSIVGIIWLAAGLYSDNGHVILFAATIVVLLIIVSALLKWIEHLGKFGRVGETIKRVENATTQVFRQAGSSPHLGALPAVPIPTEATPVFLRESGIV